MTGCQVIILKRSPWYGTTRQVHPRFALFSGGADQAAAGRQARRL